MKIAIVTDDRQTISAHFGHAVYYEVFTVDDGRVLARETRSKPSHDQFANEAHDEPGYQHGRGPVADVRHARMVDVIRDCQALIARGMGLGAFDNLKNNGIQPIITDVCEIEKAVETYLKGQLADHPERLH